jgi:hypothetical protein
MAKATTRVLLDENEFHRQVEGLLIPIAMRNREMRRPIKEWGTNPQCFDEFHLGVMECDFLAGRPIHLVLPRRDR